MGCLRLTGPVLLVQRAKRTRLDLARFTPAGDGAETRRIGPPFAHRLRSSQ